MKSPIDALKDALRITPFEPIAVVLSDGRRFEIRHPEALSLPVDGGAGEIMTPDGECHDFEIRQLASVQRLQTSSQGKPGRSA